MAIDKNKPASKVSPKRPSTGDVVSGEETATSGEMVTGDATAPDAVTEHARLGGTTVENLKAEPEEQEPAAKVSKDSGSGEMTLTPNHAELLIGNSYTAELALPKDFSEERGDVVTFMHPAGWDVKAAVTGGIASGTFLIERARAFNFGFKINGKRVAAAAYETRDA